MTENKWIVVTDRNGNAIRVQVSQIRYFRAATNTGTTICLGGDNEAKIIINVTEPPYTIDAMIGIESK